MEHLTKRFADVLAVDDVSFEAPPGRVTGFLGPNGAGKSTTLRCIMGLDRPDGGTTLVDGRPFGHREPPLHAVGSLLDADCFHPGRTGRDHLRFVAASNGIPTARVDVVLGQVGLTAAAGRRVATFSLGMRQRLGLAAALLGDPGNLVLDEPANGLDPEGVRWVRDFLRDFAAEGRVVLVSSHLLGEMALMADDVVVIGRGRLIDHCPVDEFVRRRSRSWVQVSSPRLDDLIGALGSLPTALSRDAEHPDRARLEGVTCEVVGETAARHQIVLHELTRSVDSLEDVFLRATEDAQQFRTEGTRHDRSRPH